MTFIAAIRGPVTIVDILVVGGGLIAINLVGLIIEKLLTSSIASSRR